MHAGLILILLIFCIMKGNAQEVFSFTFRETPVEEVLKKIEQQTGYIFSYSPSILHQCSLKTISIKQANLEQVLNLLFKSSNISWEKLGRYIILKQGKRFSVKSNQNKVNVLGTSFNIFSRPGNYRVTCLTGKVKVTTHNETTTLAPDMQLTYHNGKLTIKENINAGQSIGWIEDKFVFEGVPLVEVINEIERQYDIRVKADIPPGHVYTGNFSRATKPDMILEIIGKPFEIKFSIE